MKSKPAFNDHVQEKSKPAPSSKAATLVDQPAKASKKPAPGTNKSNSTTKSTEKPAEAFEKMEARAAVKSPEADAGRIRLVPTQEFAFPPPVTKSGGKNAYGSNVSVHTDGVETATTFDSADYASRGSHPADHAASEQKEDLIAFDLGGEEGGICRGASSTDGVSATVIGTVSSPVVPEIMDEDLDVDLPQISLTPKSLIAPRSITYRGAYYIRADQTAGQVLEDLLQDNRPRRQPTVSQGVGSARVAVTAGLNIGLQTLQETSATGSILGDHNLPRRSKAKDRSDTSSTTSLVGSIWATGNTNYAAPSAYQHRQSTSQTNITPAASQQQWQHDIFQNSEVHDAEMTDASIASSVRQRVATASNLAASKYATPEANVMTSQVASRQPTTNSATLPACAGSSDVTEALQYLHNPSTVPRSRQNTVTPTPHIRPAATNMKSNFSSQPSGLQAVQNRQHVESRGNAELESSRKTVNLAGSNWGNPDAEVVTAPSSKKKIVVGSPRSNSSASVAGSAERMAKPEADELRPGNPFGMDTQPTMHGTLAPNNIATSAKAAEFSQPTMTVERLGLVPATNGAPLSMRERMIQAMNSGPQAGPRTFEDSPSPRITKPVESKPAKNAMANKASTSKTPFKTPLMKYPTGLKYGSSSGSSYRKSRVRDYDSDYEDSEL
jgi:hypothetical protein